ncbi:MAG: hypothetical protein Kow0010_06330 [Dehalococcoidia bacterium]
MPVEQTLEALEQDLNGWLRSERGIAERRRIARLDDSTILVSKFEPGFASRLHEVLDRLPELFDPAIVRVWFGRQAATLPASTSRVGCWHAAMLALLAELGAERGIGIVEQAQVEAGIDSVAALLDAVLWTGPALDADDPSPTPGERAACRDAIERLHVDSGIFTRAYGRFEGRDVVNHCPGAPFARRLFAQAWEICTGTGAPL